MAAAAAEGHRVVLVVATRGEAGEVPEGFLAPGERLADRRVAETHASAALLGVSRVEFLDYVDSGMVGTPTNLDPGSFWQADVHEAAQRLAVILDQERAHALTVYDDHGTYGHPDHVQVHRVGVRAAALAGTSRVFESTVNRAAVRQLAIEAEPGNALPDVDAMDLGVGEELLTTAVDVRPWLAVKRAAMWAHASQISEQSYFLALPDDVFQAVFGVEWYIRRGAPVPIAPGAWETSLFGDLAT